MRVAFHTLGCKVNHYETEAMREAFVSRGAVSVGEDDPADVYIINTCTVTNIADRKSRQYIRRMKKLNPDALIVVTGCYAQVEPEEVASMPEVNMVVGNGQKARICGLVMERLGAANNEKLQNGHDTEMSGTADNRTDIHVFSRSELTEYEDMGLVTSSEPGMTRAYVKIQEGCDRFCAYCLIPYARGPVRSRPPEDILSEVTMLLDSGIREIVLTGINTALYGTESGFDCELTDLLDMLDTMEGDFRIRLSSLEPTVVDKDHVEKIIRYRRLCHHLHLSIQSGSDMVLKFMNRHYTRNDYLDIVQAIRDYDPVFGITTDIIVGFPGETDEDFEATMDIARRCEFGKIHVFRYSPRKGTTGASLPDVVSGDMKNRRSFELEKTGNEIAEKFRKKNIGIEHIVLIEERRGDYLTGFTGNYIRTYIEEPDRTNDDTKVGEFCRVVLMETFLDGCKAEKL